MLEIRDLTTRWLRPLSFSLASGECVAVRGPSGAGKSLLLRAIADLDPSTGRVLLDRVDRDSMSGPEWRRRLGYVPAEPGWWADRVGDHFTGWDGVASLIERLGFPNDVKNWPVARLSTGERIRLGIIRALSVRPQVLLLDEPTASLDPSLVSKVEELIAERVTNGLSVLWVTHDVAQALRVSKRCLSVDRGRVTEAIAA